MRYIWNWIVSLFKCSCGHERVFKCGTALCVYCDRDILDV